MNTKNIFKIFGVILFSVVLSACQQMKDVNKPFKHNTPLIKEDIKKSGRAEIQKTLELGPKPADGKKVYGKRKKISSEAQRNYLLIPDTYPLLKQRVTLKFKNLDFKETMHLMGKIGEINVLVGDEVAGAISAELVDVPWDKAFQALLDMKNYASDIDVNSNLIRIHSPGVLTEQENYKSDRAQAVKRKVELEDSVEPIISEIFRLYYITPSQAKSTLEELFTSRSGDSSFIPIQVTEENTTRSIIVRGKEPDLDVVDKLIKEIDIRTKQVLIEAFIVEANSDFERALGTRLGGYYLRGGSDRSFLEFIQILGNEFGINNKIIFVDSSSGEVERPSTKKTGLTGISDLYDNLKFDLVFQNGPKEYISWFIELANKRSNFKKK